MISLYLTNWTSELVLKRKIHIEREELRLRMADPMIGMSLNAKKEAYDKGP